MATLFSLSSCCFFFFGPKANVILFLSRDEEVRFFFVVIGVFVFILLGEASLRCCTSRPCFLFI